MRIASPLKSSMTLIQLIVLVIQQVTLVRSFTYQQTGYWETSDCTGAPFYMDIFPEFSCGQRNITYNCSPYTFHGTEYYRTVICVEDTHMWTWSYYQSMPYVMMEQYAANTDCNEYLEGQVFVASDNCVKMINSTSYQSAIACMGNFDSESLQLFTDDECASNPAKNFSIESYVVADHSCYDSEYKFYSQSEYTSVDTNSGSASASSGGGEALVNSSSGNFGSNNAGISSNSGEKIIESANSTGLSTGAYAGIGVAALAFVVFIAWLIYWWGRRSEAQKQESTAGVGSYGHAMETSPTSDFISEASGDGAALWSSSSARKSCHQAFDRSRRLR